MRFIRNLFFFAAMGGCMLIAKASTPTRQTVVFLGDSITFSWDLAAAFPTVNTINKGIGGNNTGQMLARFNSDVVANHPDSVVVLGGVNDIAGGLSASTIESNLDAIAHAALAAHIRPYLCSILSTTPAKYSEVNPAIVSAVNTWMQGEASSLGVQYVDYYTNFVPATMTIEGLHPNDSGYAYMQGVLSAFIH